MNFSKKTLSRIVACTLIAGLAAPYTILDALHTVNSSVYAVDASASDVFIGTPLDSVRCSLYTDGEKSFNMNGRTYYQGIVMGDGTYTDNAEISYNVEGTETISFDLGHIDNTDESKAEFSIYLDEVLEDKFTLSCSQPIENYELKTSGASKLRIARTGDLSKYALANVTVDGVAPSTTCTIPEYKTTAAFLGSNYDCVRSSTYDGFSNENFFMMNGRQYYQGIVMGDGSYNDNAYISFNVENVKTLSFSLGHIDDSDSGSAEFSVYLDNVLEDKLTLSQNELISTYTLDVSNASTVRIFRNGDCSKYGIADISVDDLAPATTYSTPTYKTSATFVNSIYDNYRTKIYDGYSSAISFNMNGRSYYQGIVLGDGSYNDNSAFSVNVENLKTISFTLGHVDNSDASSSEFCVYIDNVLEDKFTLSQNEPLKEYSIDVSKASTLRIFRNGDCSQYALADIKADELTPKNSYSVPQYKNSAAVTGGIYDNFRTSVYDGISGSVFFNMAGRKYFQGIILGDGSYNDDAAFSLNVENLKTISFDLGHVDDSAENECELSVYLDNEMVDKIKMTRNMLIEPYTLDVADSSTLRIIRNGDCSKYALGDITADELNPKNLHSVPTFINSAKFVDSAYDTIRSAKYIDDNKFTYFTMNGINYTQGITIGDDSYNDNGRVSFNVENLDSVSFTVGHVDEKKATEATLTVYCDNELVETIALTGDIVPTEYSIDVSKTSTLIIHKNNDCGTYGLGSFKIKASSTENPPVVTTTAVITTAPVTTSAPVLTTKVPVTTSVPAVTTKVPVTTSVPAVTTKVPVTTSVPAVTTKVPVTTSVPAVTTKVPVITSVPAVTTKAPSVTTTQEPSTTLRGDLNGDGDLTTSDVRILLQSLVGSYTLTEEQKILADVDADGILTSTDALKLLRYIVGASETL